MFYNAMGDFGDSWDSNIDIMPGYGDMGYSGYGYGMNSRPPKATSRNVQEEIAYRLNSDMTYIDFVKLDELPDINDWKHSCLLSGVVHMNVEEFIFYDGSRVVYGVCPFFPECNRVHYYIDRY